MKASVDAKMCALTGYRASAAPEVSEVSYGEA
jgi:hypothetical protein